MVFKMKQFTFVFSAVVVVFLAAGCGDRLPPSTAKDEYNIGEPLESITPVLGADGTEMQKIAIYDETAKGIHRFDLQNMKHLGFDFVTEADQKHFVLSESNGQYVIDLTLKHMTIFTKDQNKFSDPIQFQGTPRSAAFQSSSGSLVIYDSMMNVSLLKLNSSGVVLKKSLKGPVIGGVSVAAGDMDAQGNLILALSNGSVVVADLEASMNSATDWFFVGGAPFASGLTDINWVAPLLGTTRVLLRSPTTLALYDYGTRTMIASKDLSSYRLTKLSKKQDPHLIVASGSDQQTLLYVQGDAIAERVLFKSSQWFLVSNLNLAANRWQMVTSDMVRTPRLWFDDINAVKEKRSLKSYRLSDMLALQNLPLADQGQVSLANSYLFTLFPSELGYAVRQNIETGEKWPPLKMFNVPYLRH